MWYLIIEYSIIMKMESFPPHVFVAICEHITPVEICKLAVACKQVRYTLHKIAPMLIMMKFKITGNDFDSFIAYAGMDQALKKSMRSLTLSLSKKKYFALPFLLN